MSEDYVPKPIRFMADELEPRMALEKYGTEKFLKLEWCVEEFAYDEFKPMGLSLVSTMVLNGVKHETNIMSVSDRIENRFGLTDKNPYSEYDQCKKRLKKKMIDELQALLDFCNQSMKDI